jgi:hypothetical protein
LKVNLIIVLLFISRVSSAQSSDADKNTGLAMNFTNNNNLIKQQLNTAKLLRLIPGMVLQNSILPTAYINKTNRMKR